MPQKPNHDIPNGPLHSCQVCGSKNLELVIDLGHQPLSDSLLTKNELDQPETSYPLRLFRCLECFLTQLDYVVPGEIVYHKQYPYRSGITKEVVDHHMALGADVVKSFGLTDKDLVVDIGSNDGTLLSAFKKQGTRVLGVEPTDIARFAVAAGIPTKQSFFTEAVAKELAKEHGQASLLTATNVFAHMAPLGEVMRGAEAFLKPGGLFLTESHYLVDILRLVQYDTIYHEHLRSYSLASLVKLFDFYDFTVVDAHRVDRYAGSLRVVAAKGRNQPQRPSVKALLDAEKSFGLYEAGVYKTFREKSQKAKEDLLEWALRAKKSGKRFVGNSCPARSSTLLNFTGIDEGLMPYIAEQPTSLKKGLFLPGKHIPVVDNEILFREQPDSVVLLAWHYGETIGRLLRERGLKSELIVPLPEVSVLKI